MGYCIGTLQYIEMKESYDIDYSKLYYLRPMKLGTFYVESLTSYISCLAEEHNISKGTLINKILVPNMDKEYLFKSAKHVGNRFYDGAKSINGYCKNTLDYLKVLGTLTLRNIECGVVEKFIEEKLILVS
ncbi:hypothetical protein CN959_20845 [Bacillus cereus]|nr:hypothetical protein CN511_02450 [Bacillus thuringiensis]PFT59031.1 hypothetical protein COK82_13770 [Bacillus thuringiensis]PGM86979.1 hypothetical protein CN953_30825 [Bacillus thuringiensis]PGM99734.1 hypothetical protein CN959_20845 [Bacillus cereus]